MRMLQVIISLRYFYFLSQHDISISRFLSVSACLGVNQENVTIWDGEKEPGAIERMEQSADKVPSIFKVCQNISNLHKICTGCINEMKQSSYCVAQFLVIAI